MSEPLELDLFTRITQPEMPVELTLAEKYAEWKALCGGNHVMRLVYRNSARFARRYKERGRRVSIKYIWEMTRDQISEIKKRCRAKGIKITNYEGYALNNSFTGLVARDIIEHRPEWYGMFELREMKAR